MTSFDDRENTFEKKYAHDEEMLFKATARRNKLFGLWAAEKLGKSGAAAEAYAKDVVISDFELPGDEDVLQKVLKDFTDAGVDTDAPHLRKKMDQLLVEAKQAVMAE